jgi:undecaprenyl-diphosphatase
MPPPPERPTRPRSHVLLARHRAAFVSAFVFLAAALTLMIVMAFEGGRAAVADLDGAVRRTAQSMQATVLTVPATALSVVGTWYITWPLRLLVAIWLGAQRRWEALWAWLIAIAIYEPLIGILKVAYSIPRPPEPAVGVTGFAFPSGHAAVGAAVAIGLVIVLVPAGPRRRYLEVMAGWFAFFMAGSRIYLDAHWLSDVVTGTAIGAAVMIGSAATVHEVGDRLHWRRIRRDADRLDAGEPEPA